MLACTEIFVNLLESKNFKYSSAQLTENEDLVSLPYDGQEVDCIFSGDKGEYLSLYCYYESVDDEKVADVIMLCNELNSVYKWVKFFVNDKQKLVIEDDALLSLDTAGDEAFELIVRMVHIVSDEKKKIMRTLYA